MSVSPKTVLITGCSTGVGLATAILLAKHDEKKFKVYATIRDIGACKTLEKEAGESLNSTLFIKQLDVTSKEQIDSVIDEILAAGERIDILVNNAGIGIFGPLESQSMDKIREMFSTNVYGSINVTKKLLSLWRETRSGHLIMISSVGGVVGIPFNSTYSASKFAIEGFAESVAHEFKRFGLKVSIIEPGPVVSRFAEKLLENSQCFPDPGSNDSLTREMVDTFVEKGKSRFATMGQRPEEIASYVLEAIESTEPRLRYHTNKLYSTAIEQKLNDSLGQNLLDAFKD